MVANYIAAALRNLVRNKLYAAINIIGLSIGFAAALLIAVFVRDELTFDTWFPGYEDVYRVAVEGHPPGAPPIHIDAPGAAVAPMFQQDLPEVIASVRLVPQERGVRQGDVETNETIVWTDPEIFTVLPYTAIAGDLKTALRSPDTLVITQAAARKFFGRDNVLGEVLEIDRKYPMRIAAVLADPPSRSHLNIRVFASGLSSFSPLAGVKCCSIAAGGGFTYLRIKPGAFDVLQRTLSSIVDRYVPPDAYGLNGGTLKASEVYAFELQPLAGLHMYAPSGGIAVSHYGMLRGAGDRTIVSALMVTGILILLVAIANFVNLMTARATRRAGEVATRKTSGARRSDLIQQFLFESFLYVGVSLLAAVALVRTGLPAFSAFLERDITLALFDAHTVIAVPGLFIVTGLLGGLYPAFVLSAFHPVRALKIGTNGSMGSALVRQALVFAQFAILIGLIVATIIIGRQTAFATGNHFRLDTDQMLFIATPCPESFRNTVAALPGVRGVACTGNGVLDGVEAVGLTTLPDGTRFNLYYYFAEPGFLELYGLKPLAGRLLSAELGDGIVRADGTSATVINEAAMRAMQVVSPEAVINQSLPQRGAHIVGVVPDFPIRSVRDPIAPAAFKPGSKFSYLAVKLEGDRAGETLRAIDQAWENLNPGRPIRRQFYNQHVQAQYTDIIRQTQAFTAFSMTAVFIACLGLFGLAAFVAERRTKEIGIRKAMGAEPGDLLRLLVWQFTKPVLFANVLAWPAAYAAMRYWLEGFAYHIDLDPWPFLGASAAALVIAMLTVGGHAWLVARTPPVAALRYE